MLRRLAVVLTTIEVHRHEHDAQRLGLGDVTQFGDATELRAETCDPPLPLPAIPATSDSAD